MEIPVDTSRTMLIAMNEDQQALSEVVVVGVWQKEEVQRRRCYGKNKFKGKRKIQDAATGDR